MLKKFFKWWYTDSNGDLYMTFLECSREDLGIVAITTLLCLGIVITYFKIANYNRKLAKEYPKSIFKSYLLEKTNVFILCLISGYFFIILSVVINPYKLRALFLLLLLWVSIRFYNKVKKATGLKKVYEGEQVYLNTIKRLEDKLESLDKK